MNHTLRSDKNVEVVAWLDRNYKKLQQLGLAVDGDMSLLSSVGYDKIIIAVINSAPIRKALLEFGVPEEKLMDIL